MALYAGVNGAVKKLYPYCGRANAVKRIIRSKCGVANAVRECQCYLDEIDHVEIEFYDVQIYTGNTSDGGTKVCEGKANCSSRGGSISFSGKSVTLQVTGEAPKWTIYTHFRFWMVLKDGYRLRLDYAKTADAKTITASVSWAGFYSSSGTYYYMYYWLLGDTDCPIDTASQNRSGSDTVTLSSGYSGGIREMSYYKNQVTRHTVTFGNVVIGGHSYSVTLRDSTA